MANKLYEEENVRAIADAIRTKTGDIGTMTLAEMPSKIALLGGYGAYNIISVDNGDGTQTLEISDADVVYGTGNLIKTFGVSHALSTVSPSRSLFASSATGEVMPMPSGAAVSVLTGSRAWFSSEAEGFIPVYQIGHASATLVGDTDWLSSEAQGEIIN